MPTSETEGDNEPSDQTASKKDELSKENENVINLKNFKK